MLKIGEGCPSTMAILENAHGLARYAQIAQVPHQLRQADSVAQLQAHWHGVRAGEWACAHCGA